MTWQDVVRLYVAKQRSRIVAVYAPGTEEFDGTMDGLRIAEVLLGRNDSHQFTACLLRRKKAEQGMHIEIQCGEWTAGQYRRHHYTTIQLVAVWEVMCASLGDAWVSGRAKQKYAELAAELQREGNRAA